MTCYAPLQAYKSRLPGNNGGFGITWNKDESNGQRIQVGCGHCIGCKLHRSKEWGIRAIHEAQMHEDNCFITLTYNDKHLPEDESLNVKHFQLFIKRLRKHNKPKKIRYIHSGEYGATCPLHNTENCKQCGSLQRPHYHAILFNHDFKDKIPWKIRNDNQTYRSPTLEKLWPLGNSEIGTVTFQSAAYVARYTVKKITGDNAHAHYQKINPETGEIIWLKPEYMTSSRNPGIGFTWYQKYKNDLYPRDECVIDGRIMKPPRYYDKLYEKEQPHKYKQLKLKRKQFNTQHPDDNTWQRLQQREQVKHAQLNQLTRQLEN